jgi:glycine/D-amino acid oxidase-like deaminating enzyme
MELLLVDPARLVWGLERACIKLGVKIFENSHKLIDLERTKNGMIVHTPYGSVYAQIKLLLLQMFLNLLLSVLISM